MKPRRRPVWLPAVLWAVALASGLSLAAQFPQLAPRGWFGSVPLWLVWTLLLALAALHRPLGGTSLSLGTLLLAPGFVLLGAIPTVLAALVAGLAGELVLRGLLRTLPDQPPERRRLSRCFEAAASQAMATLAAGLSWSLAAPNPPTSLDDSVLYDAITASAGAYLLILVAVRMLDHRVYRREEPVERLSLLLPLIVDLIGWWMGAVLVVVAGALGVTAAAAVAAVAAALAAEAFRLARGLGIARQRVGELEEVSRASQRMIAGSPELAAMARQILSECSKLIPFRWFHLELVALSSGSRSWAAGPDGVLFEGTPTPERYPPARPGFHRRSAWRVVEYSLNAESKILGSLRLWTDPRTLDGSELGLLEALLPQLSASVQRALLDREAKLDPLTGVAIRRALENRLTDTYQRVVDEGGSMALLMCDLDYFKKINDTYGHSVGDQALVAVARVLSGRIKQTDLCCRWGGEEFLILVSGADGGTGLAVAERLRREVEGVEILVEGSRVPISLSAGIAAFPELYASSPAELIALADGALYEAKRRGRNLCLLDMGRGRFRAPIGTVFTNPESRPSTEAPRIFV